MTQAKHTQGPWHVKKDGDMITIRGVEINKLSREIAEVNPHVNPFTEGYDALDNARLIAAAPELLQQLQETCDWYEVIFARLADTFENNQLESETVAILEKARAAIAKARGQ